MTEMYKTKNGLNPSFMEGTFCENAAHYHLHNNNEFAQPRVKSASNGTESIQFKGPRLWQMLPPIIRNSESLCQFKTKIKMFATGKIVHADDAERLFNNFRFLLSYCIFLMPCKYFIHVFLK